jgi:thiamine kinase-like enzyme
VSAQVNEESNDIFEEIKALPCFVNHSCEVKRVTGGESHDCFKITFIKNDIEECYFVKSFSGHQETAVAEISSNLLAAEAGLAPAIIYYSPLWLVCEYIHGESLAKFTAEKTSLVFNDRVMIAMNLMVKMHQLKHPQNHPILNIEKLLVTLIKDIEPTHLQQVFFNETIKEIIPLQLPNNNLVLCHGDVNYENIRLSDTYNKNYPLEKSWLVDFECSCLAEAEYDIAMFIAINTRCAGNVEAIVKQYQLYANVDVDNKKVLAYLACCYLINGLWYLKLAGDNKKNQTIRQKACQQLVLFDQLELMKQKVSSLF